MSDDTECPICRETMRATVQAQCGHECCPTCFWRLAATTRRCWACRETIDGGTDQDGNQVLSDTDGTDDRETTAVIGSVIMSLHRETLQALVFVIDYKTVSVSLVFGTLIGHYLW